MAASKMLVECPLCKGKGVRGIRPCSLCEGRKVIEVIEGDDPDD